MKKYIGLILALVCVLCLSLHAIAAETLYYTFDGSDSLTSVTNTLKAGANAAIGDGVLKLNGTYGLKLGSVGSSFSVSAMVKIDSNGGTDTIFFKDMDNKGDKWTGVLSNAKKPSFWTHGTSHRWETVASGTENLGEWSHIAYVENNSTGSLYVNGELVGSGSVESGAGTLYLGATYWSADAPSGMVDNVKLFNNALTAGEVMSEYESNIDFESALKLPRDVISDIELVKKVGTKVVTWASSNEAVIDREGKVTRADEDVTVTLTATVDGEVVGEFEVTVLKKPGKANDDVILSYVFDLENDGDIIHDMSGNGNHGAAYNGLEITKDGAHFDGTDDYVKLVDGILYGHDEITICTTFKPTAAQKHVFLYGFGNGTETGYMFLNPSRPTTNTLRFAMTKTNAGNESSLVSLPGIRINEEVNVTVVIVDKYASMYVDGELVMDGDLGMTVSALGETKENYIGKSLYEADPYFAGYMKEFTVYNYAMRESRIKELYGKSVEYAESDEVKEYIQSVSFENGIEVTVDTFNRNDVKIGVVVLDENYEVIEFSVNDAEDEIAVTKDGTVCVFAFDEETNTPGSIFVKGEGEGFTYEHTPGVVKITAESTLKGGIAIVAGYDTTGALTGVVCKAVDLTEGVGEAFEGDFENAVMFKMFYWGNLVAMIPME